MSSIGRFVVLIAVLSRGLLPAAAAARPAAQLRLRRRLAVRRSSTRPASPTRPARTRTPPSPATTTRRGARSPSRTTGASSSTPTTGARHQQRHRLPARAASAGTARRSRCRRPRPASGSPSSSTASTWTRTSTSTAQQVGSHPYGYTGFTFDLTDAAAHRRHDRQRASRSRSATSCRAAAGTRAAASTATSVSSSPIRCTSRATAPSSRRRTLEQRRSRDGYARPCTSQRRPATTSAAAGRSSVVDADGRASTRAASTVTVGASTTGTADLARRPARSCGRSTDPHLYTLDDRAARRRQTSSTRTAPASASAGSGSTRTRASPSTARTPRSRASTCTTTSARSAPPINRDADASAR